MRQARVRQLGDRSLRILSRRMGINHATVSRWETGESRPTVADLLAYAEACGVRPEDLVRGIVRPPAEQLVLDLEPPVGRAVLKLVDVLKERPRARPPRTAAAG